MAKDTAIVAIKCESKPYPSFNGTIFNDFEWPRT